MRAVITCLTLLAAIELTAQSTLSQQLLALEYKVFQVHSDTERTALLLEKMQVYIDSDVISPAAFSNLIRIDPSLIPAKQEQVRFFWNAALIAQANASPNYAVNYFSRYTELSGDSGTHATLLGILLNENYDADAVNRYVQRLRTKSDSFSCLSCVLKTMDYHLKGKGAYTAASAVVPGSGSMALGYVGKGATSLITNGAVAYGLYLLIQNQLYANAAFMGVTFGIRFYSGNLRLTRHLFDQKESRRRNLLAEDCRKAYEKFLLLYPLNFK